jgi:hypothetical protein
MKKLAIFPLQILLACLLFSSLTAGSAHAATVRGRLVHANGYPAAGVAVTVFNQQVGRSSPAYAGPDGMYYLYNVRPGIYYVEVWVRASGPPVVYQIRVVEPYTDIPPIRTP